MHVDRVLRVRKQNRLIGYDYSLNGAYFVTICTKDRIEILSEICRGGALLRPIGFIVESELNELTKRYNATIDKYVIMPNHIHILIIIQWVSGKRAEQSPAPTLSDIICTFKSITTRKANDYTRTPGQKLWQRSFHDRIIRDEHEYQMIWQYIDANPLTWNDDRFFTKNNP